MDKALKQRLVGASVLIILAVIVLPMLLSGRSDTLKQESHQIELPPKPEELSIETRRFPVGVPNQAAASTGQEAGETGGSHVQEQVQAAETDYVENTATETNSPSNIEVKSSKVTSITLSSGRDKNANLPQTANESQSTPRYLVQVASFSSEKNANTLASQLRADNLPVLMDVVDRTAGRLHRVRIGPYADRSDADLIISSLRSKMKDINPRVLDLRPTESAPVSIPSDPLVRWVVQVGSFSNQKSAETLVAELRLAELNAFLEKVSSTNGTVYKVRIGPEIDRDRAIKLVAKVKAQHPDAFLTTQE